MKVFHVRKAAWVNPRRGESRGVEGRVKGTTGLGWSKTVGCLPQSRWWHRGAAEDAYSSLFFLENGGRAILREFTLEEMLFLWGGFSLNKTHFYWPKTKLYNHLRNFWCLQGCKGGDFFFFNFICVVIIVSNLPPSHKVSPIWGFKPNCHPCLDMALQ